MSKILIIEDNERTRRMLIRRLEKLNHVVIEVSNGTEAITRIKREIFDVVLLDQMMPDMNGIETFNHIRETISPSPPVIMMTAHATLHLAVQFLKAGGDDFIQKPLDFDILDSKIHQVIKANERLQKETTARIEAEKALAEERHLLRSLIDTLPSCVYVKDMEGRYILSNAAHIHSMNKKVLDEVVGKTSLELFPQKVTEQSIADEQKVIQTGEPLNNIEEISATQNSEHSWGLTNKVPLRNEHGDIIGLVGVTVDITEIKQAEEELKKSKVKLSHSLRREKELNELRTRSMGTVSHEFRTPLTIIQLSSEFLERYKERLSPKQREDHLKQISNQVRLLNEMVDNIVLVLQAEANSVKLNLSLVNLETLCRGIINVLESSIGLGHNFTFNCEQGLNNILADKNHLDTILTNLISNAIKYSPDSKEIHLNLFMKNNEQILQVSDNGIGIPPDDLEQLFQPYHRAGNVDHIRGIGLGLQIVKDLTERHNGRIEVESNLGKGTTFTMFLPIKNESSTAKSAN